MFRWVTVSPEDAFFAQDATEAARKKIPQKGATLAFILRSAPWELFD